MESFLACFCARTQTAKLLDNEGNLIQKVKLPAKAAELMLENPGHVISPVDALRKTRRISALRADDELQGGKVYALMAASRIRAKVSATELKNIELGCKKKVKENSSKVRPTMADELREDEEIQTFDNGFSDSELGFCVQKRWNPNLETISEDFSFRER